MNYCKDLFSPGLTHEILVISLPQIKRTIKRMVRTNRATETHMFQHMFTYVTAAVRKAINKKRRDKDLMNKQYRLNK